MSRSVFLSIIAALALAGCATERSIAIDEPEPSDWEEAEVYNSPRVVPTLPTEIYDSIGQVPESCRNLHEYDRWAPIEFEPLEQWREQLEATRTGLFEEGDPSEEEWEQSKENPDAYIIPGIIKHGGAITREHVLRLHFREHHRDECPHQKFEHGRFGSLGFHVFELYTCSQVVERDGVWGVHEWASIAE